MMTLDTKKEGRDIFTTLPLVHMYSYEKSAPLSIHPIRNLSSVEIKTVVFPYILNKHTIFGKVMLASQPGELSPLHFRLRLSYPKKTMIFTEWNPAKFR